MQESFLGGKIQNNTEQHVKILVYPTREKNE